MAARLQAAIIALIFSLTLLAAACTARSIQSGRARSLSKRALFGGSEGGSGLVNCKIYQDKAFLQLFDHVCEKCYELFRKEDLHSQCRLNCFNNEIFNECARFIMGDGLLETRKQYIDK